MIMKKNLNWWLIFAGIFVAITVLVLLICILSYKYSVDFRALFGGTDPGSVGKAAQGAETLAQRNERAGWVSLYLFAGIIILQFLCLMVACAIFTDIRKSGENHETKLARIANADIFLDLPLYVGLFGSVSSFMVMSVSSSGGQLIAYSSTLVGIIFSTCMRLALMYPLKSNLIAEEKNQK